MHPTSSRGLQEVARGERDITKHLTGDELYIIRRALARQAVRDAQHLLEVVEGDGYTVSSRQGVAQAGLQETLDVLKEL